MVAWELAEASFAVTAPAAGVETAFVATAGGGTSGPKSLAKYSAGRRSPVRSYAPMACVHAVAVSPGIASGTTRNVTDGWSPARADCHSRMRSRPPLRAFENESCICIAGSLRAFTSRKCAPSGK